MSSLSSGAPEAQPLKDLEAVLQWTPVADDLTVSTVPLKQRTPRKAEVPRTLLCHDMQGGYTEDRFIQGVPQDDAYRFFHWSLVDLFVYFSHEFVTIPPPGWIDSAHLHGVLVLGLFITEWDQGLSICEEFLQTKETYTNLIRKLVKIAGYYKFDGWLINIENKIRPDLIPNLVDFIEKLTKEMHAANPKSVIIWYDSVTSTGELDWQNELNLKNKIFFDVSDGIFLNYSWNEENLKHTKEHSGKRNIDVYVGVDVFGRNMIGGGGFNTVVALEAVRKSGLSVAIFAFGWVYEKLGKESFTENEYKFWSTLSKFCPSHGPQSLPFGTSFCQGFGKRFYHRGELIHEQPWTNLSLQNFQPTSPSAYNKEDMPYKLSIYPEKPYCGGGSLCLAGVYVDRIKPTFQLLTSSFVIEEPIFISYTWLGSFPENVDVCLQLALRDSNGQQRVLHLLGCMFGSQNEFVSHCTDFDSDISVDSSPVKVDWKFPVNVEDFRHHEIDSLHLPIDSEEEWKTRGFILQPNSSSIETIERIAAEILIENPTTDQHFEVLMGNLQVIPLSFLQKPRKPIEVFCLEIETDREGQIMKVSSELLWTTEAPELLDHYSVYCQLESEEAKQIVFVGNTRNNMYKIKDLQLTNPGLVNFTLRFIVQEKFYGLKTLDLCNSAQTEVHFS